MQGEIQVKNRVFNLNNVESFLYTPPENGKPANLSMFGRNTFHSQVEGDEAEEFWAWIQDRCLIRFGVEEIPEVDEIGQPVPRPIVEPDRAAAGPIDAPCLVKAWPHRSVLNVSKMALVVKRYSFNDWGGIDVTWMNGKTASYSFNLGREIWRLFGERHLDLDRLRVNVAGIASAHRGRNDLGEFVFTLDWGAGYSKSFQVPIGEAIWNAVNEGAIDASEDFKAER